MKPLTLLHAAQAQLGRDRARDADRADERFAAFERLVDTALEVRPQAVLCAGGLVDAGGLEMAEIERLSAALARLVHAEIFFVLTPALAETRPRAATVLSLLAARGLAIVLAPHADGRLEPASEGVRGAYVDLGAQLRVVGLGAPDAAAGAELLSRAPLVAASNRVNVLLIAGAPRAAADQLEAFAYVALGGSDTAAAKGARGRDPGPLAAAAPGAAPAFLQVTIKTSGVTAKALPSGAFGLELMVLDVSGIVTLDELAAQLRRKAPLAGERRRVALKLTGDPALDLDAESRSAMVRAASQALGGVEVTLELATSYKLADVALAAGADHGAVEAAALAELLARGGLDCEGLAALATNCLVPLLDGRPEALAAAAAHIAAFEENHRAG